LQPLVNPSLFFFNLGQDFFEGNCFVQLGESLQIFGSECRPRQCVSLGKLFRSEFPE